VCLPHNIDGNELIIRAQALVMAEYEEAFERPQYGFNAGRGSGFVRAGGQLSSSAVLMSRCTCTAARW
jgi:hypothetical protein